MSYVKQIVCLAISYKPPDGRCVAGKELLPGGQLGGWIRPISVRTTAELSFSEYRYGNNASPKLLDVIDVPLLKASPHHHQTENHLIDARKRWAKHGEFSWHNLGQLRDDPPSLWVNSDHTKLGTFDCISRTEALTLASSLFLIAAPSLIVKVGIDGRTGKRTFRADFGYRGVRYNFSLTDPEARESFAGKGEGGYPLEDVYLCVSLTGPFQKDGRCHKLVAAVIGKIPL